MKNKTHIKLIVFLFLLFFSINQSLAAVLEKISISGNLRISNETIITFLPVKINDEITNDKINIITKELYNTNFFKNVTVKFIDNELQIDLVENPIIQNIIYNGIKSDTLRKFITDDLELIERSSFIDIKLKNDISSLAENLKKRGYYFAKIDAKLEYLDDNLVNLIFDIDLGNKAKIKKISFVGNKVFKDNKLRGVILSEEYKFWKFISGKKFLNQDLVNFDKNLLKNFYVNNGYYNVNISSSFAKLINEDEFELIYNINSGEKIYFGDLNLNLPNNYDENNFLNLRKVLNKLSGKPYSINSIEKIVNEIEILALNEQFESIDVIVNEIFNDNKLNINFLIEETEKIRLSRINILGNNVTRENVIRNQFAIDEGDLFNEILYAKTLNNIKALNFFKTVNGKVLDDEQNESKIIEISVEEKATGEIGASAGVGTSGSSIGVFINENNYLGKGLGLTSNLVLSTESIKGLFSIRNPNFNDTDKSVYASLEATEIDRLKSSGYKTNKTGFSYGTQFEILDDFEFGIGNKNYYQNIETDSTASELQKKQKGDYLDSILSFDFIYDKRNQKFKPSDGFRSYYGIEIPIISETNTLSNIFDYKFYTELYDQNITSLSLFAKTSTSITNEDIKLTERNFLPSSKLRGFTAGGIGPKDGNDFIGGNYAASINLNSNLPQLMSENQNIDFLIFLDVANVWGVDYDKSLEKNDKIRSSAGIGVDWFTPIGPLNFTFSQPISKANTDSTESFRFNIGTTF